MKIEEVGAEQGNRRCVEGPARRTLRAELANLEQQSAEVTQKWQAEKDKIHAEAKIKEELDAATLALDQAQRAGDLAKAGELQLRHHPRRSKSSSPMPKPLPATRCCAKK